MRGITRSPEPLGIWGVSVPRPWPAPRGTSVAQCSCVCGGTETELPRHLASTGRYGEALVTDGWVPDRRVPTARSPAGPGGRADVFSGSCTPARVRFFSPHSEPLDAVRGRAPRESPVEVLERVSGPRKSRASASTSGCPAFLRSLFGSGATNESMSIRDASLKLSTSPLTLIAGRDTDACGWARRSLRPLSMSTLMSPDCCADGTQAPAASVNLEVLTALSRPSRQPRRSGSRLAWNPRAIPAVSRRVQGRAEGGMTVAVSAARNRS